eukprot:COSAG05_NODE_14065_length_409_cov_0.832258_1_plen_69_part_00
MADYIHTHRQGSGLGEVRLHAVFLLEGDDEAGWDDDDDPEHTDSDEEELWEAVRLIFLDRESAHRKCT